MRRCRTGSTLSKMPNGGPQVNGKVTVTLEGVATMLRVLQEKLPVMPEQLAAKLREIHTQVLEAGSGQQPS